MEDIIIEDKFFDDKFIIQSNDKDKIKFILKDDKLKNSYILSQKFHLKLKIIKVGLVDIFQKVKMNYILNVSDGNKR